MAVSKNRRYVYYTRITKFHTREQGVVGRRYCEISPTRQKRIIAIHALQSPLLKALYGNK